MLTENLPTQFLRISINRIFKFLLLKRNQHTLELGMSFTFSLIVKDSILHVYRMAWLKREEVIRILQDESFDKAGFIKL